MNAGARPIQVSPNETRVSFGDSIRIWVSLVNAGDYGPVLRRFVGMMLVSANPQPSGRIELMFEEFKSVPSEGAKGP